METAIIGIIVITPTLGLVACAITLAYATVKKTEQEKFLIRAILHDRGNGSGDALDRGDAIAKAAENTGKVGEDGYLAEAIAAMPRQREDETRNPVNYSQLD